MTDSDILWHIEAMKAQIVDGVLPKILRVGDFPDLPGFCWSCGDPMLPWDPSRKCVPCCLAAAHIVLDDIKASKTVRHTGTQSDTSPAADTSSTYSP